ncbi:MAG: FHA domain-containing protein [Dehalococcoidia bacterium]
MARLLITSAAGDKRVLPLAPGETTIGRSPACDVVLEGDGVSRTHAVIAEEGPGFVVRDAGSKNGTLVNGEPVAGLRALADGDTLTIPGWTVLFENEEPTVTRSFSPGGSLPASAGRTVVLKPETKEVVVRGETVLLAPKEYLALSLLYARAGTIVSKEDLADHVWPEYKGDVSDYNIHQVLSRLRRELEEDPSKPKVLITRPGFGYMLVP